MHRSGLTSVVIAAITSVTLGGCGGEKTALRLSGGWQAHARTFSITQTGHGREWLSLGMSSPSSRRNFAFDIRFRLSDSQATPRDATGKATITAVRIGGQSVDFFKAAHRGPPRVGESFRIRLRNGVVTSGLSGARYCGPGVDWPKAGCGA